MGTGSGSGHTRLVAAIGLVTALVGLTGALATSGLLGAHSPTPEPVSSPTPEPPRTSTTPATNTSADWRHRAISMCLTTQAFLADQYDKHDPAHWWDFAPVVVADIHVLDNALRGLDAPDDVRQRIQLMTQHWDQAHDAIGRAAAAASRGDIMTRMDEVQNFVEPNARGNQIAEDLGLSACSALDTRLVIDE